METTDSEKRNPGPFLGYRRMLLAQALIGCGDYHAACGLLEKPLPELWQGNTEWLELHFEQAESNLSAGDNQLARQALNRMNKEGYEPTYADNLVNIYMSMTELSRHDDIGARRVKRRLLAFWKNPDLDKEAIPHLEAASAIMRRLGYADVSLDLATSATNLKQQERKYPPLQELLYSWSIYDPTSNEFFPPSTHPQ